MFNKVVVVGYSDILLNVQHIFEVKCGLMNNSAFMKSQNVKKESRI